MVSKVSIPAFLLAPTVVTKPSTTISSLVNPSAVALSSNASIKEIFSSKLSGKPLSDNGSKINIAPYFFAIGNN